MKMTSTDYNESSLGNLILSELSGLLKEIETDVKQRNLVKKYLSDIKRACERSDMDALTRILMRKTKEQLFSLYPLSRGSIEKILLDIKRHSEEALAVLYRRFQEYCNNRGISIQGKMPKFVLDHLLEVQIDPSRQSAKVGTIYLPTLDWEKIRNSIDRERKRIWDRPYDPGSFRDKLLQAYDQILKLKPNPVGWARLEDIYQFLKREIEQKNPNWKKEGRLVSYYRDEFSADLSKLWKAQVKQEITPPHMELSGIRDPRLSYKVVLPDGQIASFGHMRPKKEVK